MESGLGGPPARSPGKSAKSRSCRGASPSTSSARKSSSTLSGRMDLGARQTRQRFEERIRAIQTRVRQLCDARHVTRRSRALRT